MEQAVLVTGGTGYIGAWVVKMLLERGYTVRLAVREAQRSEKYRHLAQVAEAGHGKLEVWEADLLHPGSYDAAAEGCEAVLHIASPFKLKVRDAEQELIQPALQGTENVLRAAGRSSTVRKVVLTSSVAAVHGDVVDMTERGVPALSEAHFNESSSPTHQPYSYSKVAAEKLAWKIAGSQRQWRLVVLNPGFVVGPAWGPPTHSGSFELVGDLLSGKYWLGVPEIRFGFVDVRDVAAAHIAALEKAEARGRYLLVDRVMTLYQLSEMIRSLFGNRFRLPMWEIPKWAAYLMGWAFGLSPKFIRRNVGWPLQYVTERSRRELGITYTPIEQSVRAMVLQMAAHRR